MREREAIKGQGTDEHAIDFTAELEFLEAFHELLRDVTRRLWDENGSRAMLRVHHLPFL